MVTRSATSCYAVFVYTQYVKESKTRNPVTFLDCLLFTWLTLQNSSALIVYVVIEWTASPSSIQLTMRICLNNSLQLARFIGMLSAVLTPDLLMSTLILGINSLYSGFSFLKQFILESKPLRQLIAFL